MLAENSSFDSGRDGSSHDHTRENRLVEVADNLFYRECHSGDRRIERSRNARGSADGEQSFQIFLRQRKSTPKPAGDAGANVNGRPFAPERRARTDLQRAYYELPDRVSQRKLPA